MPFIDKIKLPGSQNAYEIHDSGARDAIASLSGGSYFLGVTTDDIKTDDTCNPVTIDGETITAYNGNMAIYGNGEFVWACTSYTYYSKNTTSDNPPKYYYTVIANPTDAQKDAAIFVNQNVPTSSATAISTPLADGASIIKHEASGHWVEFGDTTMLGNLAYHDNVVLSKNTYTVPSGFTYGHLTTSTIGTASAVTGVSTTSKKLKTVDVLAIAQGSNALTGVSTTKKKLAAVQTSYTTPTNSTIPTWQFEMGSGADSTTLVISSGTPIAASSLMSVTPVAAASINLTTGESAGDEVVTATSTTAAEFAKIASNTIRLATGEVVDSDTYGGTVVTAASASGTNTFLQSNSSATVVTGIGASSGDDEDDVIVAVNGTQTVLLSTTTIAITDNPS